MSKAVAAARPFLEGTDARTIRAAREKVAEAWSEAGADNEEAWELMMELDSRIKVIEVRGMEAAARPCVQCDGREFAVSKAFSWDASTMTPTLDLPKMRFWACKTCGAVQLFVNDLADVERGTLFPQQIRVKGGPQGPFR